MQININKFLCIFVDFNQYTMPRESKVWSQDIRQSHNHVLVHQ